MPGIKIADSCHGTQYVLPQLKYILAYRNSAGQLDKHLC